MTNVTRGEPVSLADALKAVRRGMYQHGDDYRALVIVQYPRQLQVLWDEVHSLLQASSMQIEAAFLTTRTFKMKQGGIIRVTAVNDLTDAYLHVGQRFNHTIWLYEPTFKVDQYMTMMRLGPPGVPLVDVRAEW